jgi:hypothetical protein
VSGGSETKGAGGGFAAAATFPGETTADAGETPIAETVDAVNADAAIMTSHNLLAQRNFDMTIRQTAFSPGIRRDPHPAETCHTPDCPGQPVPTHHTHQPAPEHPPMILSLNIR